MSSHVFCSPSVDCASSNLWRKTLISYEKEKRNIKSNFMLQPEDCSNNTLKLAVITPIYPWGELSTD